jgi:hypothetical protein
VKFRRGQSCPLASLSASAGRLIVIRLPTFLAVVLVGFAVAGCRTAPVYNVSSAPVVAKSGQVSAAEVRGAIVDALHDKGWTVKQDDPGKILAEILVRERHRADIRIDYSATQYSITYMDSDKLLYDGTNIHKNYNKWIMDLQEEINLRLSEVR